MTIPVLDMGNPGFAAAFGQTCRETGFAVITGHGIEPELRSAVFSEGAAFFELPAAAKDALSIARSPHNRGYVATGAESLDPETGQTDRKEAFNIGLDLPADDPRVLAGEPFRGVNLWPADLPSFRRTMTDWFDACRMLGDRLLSIVARDLDLPDDTFAAHFTAPMATLRLLRYPPGTEGIGAGAHTDYGALTLLATDGVPGLQVQGKSGDWLAVPDVPGGFIVNIGDALMRWTNDLYVSTPHRVLPPPRTRQSVAYFHDPNPDSVIAALPGTGTAHHAPVTAADYLTGRLNATYAARS